MAEWCTQCLLIQTKQVENHNVAEAEDEQSWWTLGFLFSVNGLVADFESCIRQLKVEAASSDEYDKVCRQPAQNACGWRQHQDCQRKQATHCGSLLSKAPN